MNGWLGWAIVLGGPLLCAGAGAAFAWLLLYRRHERQLDEAFDEGCRQTSYELAITEEWRQPLRATPRPATPLGPRHAAPVPTVFAAWADAQVTSIRAEFARIRLAFGLPLQALGPGDHGQAQPGA